MSDDRGQASAAPQNLIVRSQDLESKLRRLQHERTRSGVRLTLKMCEHQALLEARVWEAIRSGRFWQIVKAELRRDYSSLFDNVWIAERRIDSEFNSRDR